MTRAGLVLAALALAACTYGSQAASPATQPSAPAVTGGCPAMELRLPDGSILDLTGGWVSSLSRMYHLYHSGSCLWWSGGMPDETLDPDHLGPSGANTMVFRGEVRSDFTIDGEWALLGDDVPIRTWGTATLRIEVQPDGAVRLVTVAVGGNDYFLLRDQFFRRIVE